MPVIAQRRIRRTSLAASLARIAARASATVNGRLRYVGACSFDLAEDGWIDTVLRDRDVRPPA